MSSAISIQHFLVLSAALFSIGVLGFISRRDGVMTLISAAVMFMASIVALAAFSRWSLLPEGKVLMIIVAVVFVVEITIGAAFVYTKKKSV